MTSAAERYAGDKHAELYAKFRPLPPQRCTDYIISYLKKKIKPPFEQAIDIGCGNGQSTEVLSPYFAKVLGLDASESQIECAKKLQSSPNIEYKVSNREKLPVESSSVQLVTFCEAIHWFKLDDIFAEVRRVLVPDGVVAVYGYWIPVPKLDDEIKNNEISELIHQYLIKDKLGVYWDKEISIVKDHYKSINLPFQDNHRMDFERKIESSLADYIGFISTWSPYQKLYKEDCKKADQLLLDVQNKLITILGEEKSPEDINLSLYSDYFLIIGHK